MAARPTAPEAEWISTRCQGFSCPRMTNATYLRRLWGFLGFMADAGLQDTSGVMDVAAAVEQRMHQGICH